MSAFISEGILQTKELVVGHGNVQVLSGVNISIERGKFISILGPNGAGKTTLLLTLARLLRPLKGYIYLDGMPLSSINQKQLAQRLSVVLTERIRPPLLPVYSFVALGRYPHTDLLGRLSPQDKKVVKESLAMVGAMDIAEKLMENLSDGERQKVFIARALAQEPEIMLLDEPTVHLDMKHKMEIVNILQGLCRDKGITVIACMHDIDIALKVSDKVLLVKDGSVMAWGSPEEILTEEKVCVLYNFNSMRFNPVLGSIEIIGNGKKGNVFVIGGKGKATPIYRILARKGYNISTGILYKNDVDWFVSQGIGIHCIDMEICSSIDSHKINKCIDAISRSDIIIDPGVIYPEVDMSSLLIEIAQNMNKKIIIIKEDISISAPENTIYISNLSHLSEIL